MRNALFFTFFVIPAFLFCSKGAKDDDLQSFEVSDTIETAETAETLNDITDEDFFEFQDIPDGEVSEGLPQSLPFELKRADEGEPLSAEEIGEFTAKITGLWKEIDFFRWVLWTSHGMDASTGKPDYMVWWHDVDAVKEGDKVTFRHSQSGGAHNIYIPTAKVLAQAIGGYLLTGDAVMGKVVEQYAKGITASMKGMVYDDKDPLEYLMSRNIVAQNHEYEIDGRKKAVDYTPWYNTYEEWNAHRIHYPNNPYWGDIWVTNMRSKDDVCHIFRTAPFLLYAAEYGKEAYVRAAAKEAYEYLQGFSKDIVDSGYYIRTKDKDGKPYIPDQDLASFVTYDELFPLGECAPKLSSALIGYGKTMGLDCGKGYDKLFEGFATASHYYNYEILRNFHMAAVLNSLVAGENDAALNLLLGLIEKIESYLDPTSDEPGKKDKRWFGELAVFLLQSASVGVPLTSREARLVHEYYGKAAEAYKVWERWDLWDKSVPDGVYNYSTGYRPSEEGHYVKIEDIAFLLEYCFSPFRNKDGVKFVDCDVVKDPGKWGTVIVK